MADPQPKIEFLRGKRVILRPALREDIPWFLKWINDPDIAQYIAAYLPTMEPKEIGWFENLAKEREVNIVLVILVDEKPIGTLGLHNIYWKDRRATMGYMIGEKEYWGKGYGTEAEMLSLHYAFNTLNLRKICASVLEFNTRSFRCLQKCGYVEEGRQKAHHFKNGRYWDDILFAVFKKNWLPLWKKFRKEHLGQ